MALFIYHVRINIINNMPYDDYGVILADISGHHTIEYPALINVKYAAVMIKLLIVHVFFAEFVHDYDIIRDSRKPVHVQNSVCQQRKDIFRILFVKDA